MNNNLPLLHTPSFELLYAGSHPSCADRLEHALEGVFSECQHGKTSVLQYSALSFALKYLGDQMSARSEKKLQETLKTHWHSLGGSKRLPRQLLRSCTREERLLHEAVFAPAHVLSGFASLKYLAQNVFLKPSDLIFITALGLILFLLPPLRWLSLGLACGYLLSSVVEHFAHQEIGHGKIGNNKKSGWFWNKMSRFFFEHEIHHQSVKQNYVKPFAPATFTGSTADYVRIQQLAQRAEFRALKKGGADLVMNLVVSEYGLKSSSTFRSHYSFAPVTLATLALFLTLLPFQGVTSLLLFSLGFLALSQLWVPTSQHLHAYLHCTRDDVERTVHHPVVKWLLNTRLIKFTARLHKTHHDVNGVYNQNLNLGYGMVAGWKPTGVRTMVDLMSIRAIY